MSESSTEEHGMALRHLLDTYRRPLAPPGTGIDGFRAASVGLAHLGDMETQAIAAAAADATDAHGALEPILTLSQLAATLSVSVQALYDLRSKGRGPRGFRVGRELRFRRSEVDAWLARLEAADGDRHRPAFR